MYYILPPKKHTPSIELLRGALGLSYYTSDTQLYPQDKLLNWGSTVPRSQFNFDVDVDILNPPERVAVTLNKMELLTCIHVAPPYSLSTSSYNGIRPYTTLDDAVGLIRSGKIVYCHTLLDGKDGEGIVVAKDLLSLVSAPLYTVGLKCKREYQVTVVGGSCMGVTAKVLSKVHSPDYSREVRRLSEGYIYSKSIVHIPEAVKQSLYNIALSTLSNLGLSFATFNIIRTEEKGYYVSSVDCTPNINDGNIGDYIKHFAATL